MSDIESAPVHHSMTVDRDFSQELRRLITALRIGSVINHIFTNSFDSYINIHISMDSLVTATTLSDIQRLPVFAIHEQ